VGLKAKEVGGHGGMDFIMDYRLVYCLRNGLPLDMDVYDAAEWSSIIELSRTSCGNSGRPVAVPDFTRGAWERLSQVTLLRKCHEILNFSISTHGLYNGFVCACQLGCFLRSFLRSFQSGRNARTH
jgi:hypothetical protein